MSKLSNYFSDTMAEMKHVSWPSRKQTISFTVLVIVISCILAAYLGIFDYIFSVALQSII